MKKPELDLTEVNGNAFALLAAAHRVAKANDMNWSKIRRQATEKDYTHLLSVLNHYFEVVHYVA